MSSPRPNASGRSSDLARSARILSVVLGLFSALSTLAIAVGYVAKWASFGAYHPYPQVEYFFVTALIALLALLEGGLSLRGSDEIRVVGMPATAGLILITGIGASIGFFEPGYCFSPPGRSAWRLRSSPWRDRGGGARRGPPGRCLRFPSLSRRAGFQCPRPPGNPDKAWPSPLPACLPQYPSARY